MAEKFRKYWKYLATGATVLSYDAAIDRIKASQKHLEHKNEIHAHIKELQNQILNLENQLSFYKDGVNKNQVIEKVNSLTNGLKNLKAIHNNYISKFEEGNISANYETSSNIYNTYKEQIDNAFNKANNKLNQLIDTLNNKFMDDFQATILKIISDYKEYLSTLSLFEICLVINIFTGLFILPCILSILMAISGNYLIEKFKLEQKLPKLSKFIQLRVKIKTLTIFLNSVLIIIAIVPLIFLNIFILFNK